MIISNQLYTKIIWFLTSCSESDRCSTFDPISRQARELIALLEREKIRDKKVKVSRIL